MKTILTIESKIIVEHDKRLNKKEIAKIMTNLHRINFKVFCKDIELNETRESISLEQSLTQIEEQRTLKLKKERC